MNKRPLPQRRNTITRMSPTFPACMRAHRVAARWCGFRGGRARSLRPRIDIAWDLQIDIVVILLDLPAVMPACAFGIFDAAVIKAFRVPPSNTSASSARSPVWCPPSTSSRSSIPRSAWSCPPPPRSSRTRPTASAARSMTASRTPVSRAERGTIFPTVRHPGWGGFAPCPGFLPPNHACGHVAAARAPPRKTLPSHRTPFLL